MPPLTPMEMLSLFLPADMLDYFDLVNHVSQRFLPGFPIRSKAVYLRVKRHRQGNPETGQTFSRDWNCESVLDTIFLQVTVLFRLVWLKCPCLLFSKLKAITHTFFSLYTRIFAGPSSVLSTSSFKHPAPGGDHNIRLTTIYLLAFLTGLYFDNL